MAQKGMFTNMQESIIIRFIVSMAKKFFDVYNNSVFEKTIGAVCGFFKKRADGSRICALFKNKFLNGEYWQNSVAFKIITSPVRLVLYLSQNVGKRLSNLCRNSRILYVFDNILYIPLHEWGILSLAYTLGAVITLALKLNFSKMSVIFVIFMTVVSVFLLVIPCSAAELCGTSAVLKFFASFVNRYKIDTENKEKTAHITPISIFAGIMFAAGICTGLVSPSVALISLGAAAGAALILTNTLFGLFLAVLGAPILPTMVSAGIILLTAFSFVLKLLSNKGQQYVITPMSFLITAFLCLAAFSAVTSFNIPKSLLTLSLYVIFAVPYFLIVNNIKTKNEWYNLTFTFVISGFIVALYGIFQNYFMETTDLSWIDEDMFSDIGIRVYSTLDNPNVLGQYLVLVTPIAFALFYSAKNALSKVLFALMTAAMFLCLVFTWSRAAWVAIVLAIGFFLVMKDRRWSSLAVLALIILPFVLPESIISRITSIGNVKDSSTAYRVSIWIASLRMAGDYWLSGIGIGTGAFERVYQNYALNGAGFALHSHNFYLQLVVEMGIIALILFILIVFSSFKQIVSIKQKNSVNKNVAIAVGGALIGYLFQGVAENLWYNYRMILIFWILIGILQSGAMLSNNDAPKRIMKGKTE